MSEKLICVKALKAEQADHPRFGSITLDVGEQYDLDQTEINRLIEQGAVEVVKSTVLVSDSEPQE